MVSAAALLSMGLSACHIHIKAASTNPKPDRFYYPAGIAIDPDGRLLYVSNNNADLRYAGGTLITVDLLRFHCAVDAFRGLTDPGVVPDAACAPFSALTAGDIQLERATDGTPTAGCVTDPIDPQIVDCIEGPFTLSNSTVRVGNFAGTIRVKRDPSVATKRRLYLAVRGDPSVTYADIDTAKLVPVAGATYDLYAPGVVDCFDEPAALATRTGYDAVTNTTTVPPRCDSSHLIQTYTCNDRLGCNRGDNDIPSEPFNILIDEGTREGGEPYSRLVVGHLAAGQVSLINLLGTPYVSDVSAPFFVANQAQQRGAFGLARLGKGEGALYYLTSSLIPQVATFSIGGTPKGDAISPGPTFTFGGAFASGTDSRALVMDPNGQRAFLAQNAPPQLAVLDLRLGQPETHGLPANKIVSAVDICQEPSNMILRQQLAATASGASTLSNKLYVSCFVANQLMVIDPDRSLVDDTILVGRGPSEMAFNYTGPETDAANQLPTPTHRYGYVALYNESTVAVIDLEPGSRTENRMVARIGMTQPPPNYLVNK